MLDQDDRITVDNLEVAQFLFMLTDNQKVRDILKTITTKTVLILGRFSRKRKLVLDAIRDELCLLIRLLRCIKSCISRCVP